MVPRPVLSPIVFTLCGLAVGTGLGVSLPKSWALAVGVILAVIGLIIAIVNVRRNF